MASTVRRFADFADLQTRIVLLPMVEEEGIGAVVSSAGEDEFLQGLTLVGTADRDLQDLEFAEILSIIRSSSTPIEVCRKISEESSCRRIRRRKEGGSC